MDLGLLKTLKEKLMRAKDLSEIMDYFLTHFGEVPEFLDLGAPTQNIRLEALLERVLGQMFDEEVSLVQVLLVGLPEHRFTHGGCFANGKLVNLFYFDDVHVGLAAVAWSLKTGETKFARFSDVTVRAGQDPSVN